ncbi:MAG: SAM-dependent methyltransferase [Lachnoclostridium sp.]|nr:SAM-dependent methyltransferase [Lachnoclostridium sp.]
MKVETESNDAPGRGATATVAPALYLIPSTMSDSAVSDVMPQRNIDIIHGIKHFVVENVRTARRFLKRVDRNIDIDSLSFTTLDEHTRPQDVAAMIAPLEAGNPIGIISEAGCPAVADPGADLVAVAQRKGLKVVPLVGPSSILLALMASGFNGQSFAFNGYLPYDTKARTAKFKEMERNIRGGQTQIFIETPYRNTKLIAELAAAMGGEMMLCVATDITGSGERIVTRKLSWWKSHLPEIDKIPSIFLLFDNHL